MSGTVIVLIVVIALALAPFVMALAAHDECSCRRNLPRRNKPGTHK